MLYDTSVYPTLHSVACASHSSTSILPPPRLAPTSLFSCSVSLLLIIFTSWLHYLDSTSKWYHTVFVILWLISLSIMTSRAIHVAANGKISFFLWLSNIPFYIYAPHLYPIFFPWMLRLLPYVGKQCCFEHWGACVFSSQGFCFFRYICSSGIAGSHGGFLIFCFVFLFFWEASILFPMMAAPIHFFFFFFHITRMVLHFEIGTPVQARWRGKYHVDALDQISVQLKEETLQEIGNYLTGGELGAFRLPAWQWKSRTKQLWGMAGLRWGPGRQRWTVHSPPKRCCPSPEVGIRQFKEQKSESLCYSKSFPSVKPLN